MRWAAAALAAALAALCCDHDAYGFKADVLPTMKVRLRFATAYCSFFR